MLRSETRRQADGGGRRQREDGGEDDGHAGGRGDPVRRASASASAGRFAARISTSSSTSTSPSTVAGLPAHGHRAGRVPGGSGAGLALV